MTRFDELMREVTVGGRFGHRQHVQLTWLAVRRHGTAATIDLVSEGLRRLTERAGVPQKYNATVSRAWVELIGHHTVEDRLDDFDEFAARNTALLDKRLLMRFYTPKTLAGGPARTGWVEPDIAPFPWT
jgi:hypothetical protein